jgi:hypothetical protein
MAENSKEKIQLKDIEIKEEEFEKHKGLPIYKKSLVIRKLVKEAVSAIAEEHNEMNLKQLMLEHAYMISSKIAGAEATELYSYRLENAFAIKRYANELMTEVALCESKKIGRQQYIDLLKDQIEELRKMFVDWVDTFDKSKDVEDTWSLWLDYGGG